jgi:poly(A) polymerase
VRRDFTINAMYYDPATQTVLDYHGGIADIRDKTLRIIGVPEARYREDPVRMLRVVRFAAKLQFTIEPATRAPIPVMAPLINNVPAARVFDEMLKLLMSGHALACLQQLRKEGLHHGLLPLLDVVLEQPIGMKFVTWRWNRPTTASSRQGRLAGLPVRLAAVAPGAGKVDAPTRPPANTPIPALHLAADDVLDTQTDKLALQRRSPPTCATSGPCSRASSAARQVAVQAAGASALPRRLRLPAAALRVGRARHEMGEWWTAFYEATAREREALLERKPGGAGKRGQKARSPRREVAMRRASRDAKPKRPPKPATPRAASAQAAAVRAAPPVASGRRRAE